MKYILSHLVCILDTLIFIIMKAVVLFHPLIADLLLLSYFQIERDKVSVVMKLVVI